MKDEMRLAHFKDNFEEILTKVYTQALSCSSYVRGGATPIKSEKSQIVLVVVALVHID